MNPTTLEVQPATDSTSPTTPTRPDEEEGPDRPAIRVGTAISSADRPMTEAKPPIITLRNVHFFYGSFRAVKDISIEIAPNEITALIGPSGCGKSTLLRTINRMNDLIPGTRLEGDIT